MPHDPPPLLDSSHRGPLNDKMPMLIAYADVMEQDRRGLRHRLTPGPSSRARGHPASRSLPGSPTLSLNGCSFIQTPFPSPLKRSNRGQNLSGRRLLRRQSQSRPRPGGLWNGRLIPRGQATLSKRPPKWIASVQCGVSLRESASLD